MKKTETVHGKKPILIYGSGKEGKLVYEAIKIDPKMQRYELAGFIDPEGEETGKMLCGLIVKTETEWLRYDWKSKPRIFIPVSFDGDQIVSKMAERWQGKGMLYRIKTEVKPVRPAFHLVSSPKKFY